MAFLSTGKVIKMRQQVTGRLKKWMIFALIGCSAYFAGYIWGQLKLNPENSAQVPSIQEDISGK
ncbi:hypothetical protein [Bdellovibrio sp. HCB2-146]|uniref:hypothetical protein n=1 Tax=Bdellovibrio sp. HCB2-146 TaxID=3394362 RepID=UPI0039BD16D2